MPIIEQIRDEYMRLRADDLVPKRLRMTHDAFATLRKAVESDEAFMLAGPQRPTFMGLPIYQEPVGSIDDPCWQIMTDHEYHFSVSLYENAVSVFTPTAGDRSKSAGMLYLLYESGRLICQELHPDGDMNERAVVALLNDVRGSKLPKIKSPNTLYNWRRADFRGWEPPTDKPLEETSE